MRGISLYHPWAMLCAINAKRWETRSRPHPYRGPLAIVAGLKWTAEIQLYCTQPPYLTALALAGMRLRDLEDSRGCVVGVTEMTECITTTEWLRRYCRRAKEAEPKDHEQEYQFGDYSPGRYAYAFENTRRLSTPYRLRAFQGIWSLDYEQEGEIRKRLA